MNCKKTCQTKAKEDELCVTKMRKQFVSAVAHPQNRIIMQTVRRQTKTQFP